MMKKKKTNVFFFFEGFKYFFWNYIIKEEEMNNNICKLYKKFYEIKNMGYVKTVRSGYTGVGATFEKLIGKDEESFEIPDYYGIEIKCKRSYSKAYITLFNAVPTGSGYYEVKRLRDNYGYPYKYDKALKMLYTDVFCNCYTKVGLWYYFKLSIDYDKERIVLLIYNYNKELIDDFTYWDFGVLKEKLERKLQYLALVRAWPNCIDGVDYYNYYKMNVYTLKGFNYFIRAIEEGKIKILIRVGSYTDAKRYGMVSSHGVGFCIKDEDIRAVFDIYRDNAFLFGHEI